MKYTARMVESRQVEVLYQVDADSPQEATEKLIAGDTIREVELKTLGVTNRSLGSVVRPCSEFNFKNENATETNHGTAYFEVEGADKEEAMLLLRDDPSEHFVDFSENHGGTDWEGPFKDN